MTKSISDTEFAKTSGFDQQIIQVIKFLAANRSMCLPQDVIEQAAALKPLIPTSINMIFDHMYQAGGMKLFASIYPVGPKPSVSVPDLLTMPITIDLKGSTHGHVLSTYPELKDKIVVNVGSLIKFRYGDTRNPQLSDINEFHNIYVRGILTRSYFESDGWLTPSLCVYIAKSYSMALSSVIQKLYNLTYSEQLVVASIFALYISQLLSRKDDDKVSPAIFNQCTFLGNRNDLNNIAQRASHLSQNGLNIYSTCQLAAELGPERMKSFNAGVFYRICSNLGSDNISTMIAFEYPPYWVHQVLYAIGGGKTRLLYPLKQNKLLEEGKRFAYDLNTSRQFIDKVVDK